ncbi:ABC transporter permease [Konateibacter massiliensis]|uniref:ABC transporter permease n=1 Tax=Konateibacter massiliensis TaxID=2002841 RepID=UPI000C145B21|nr:ABC transporter permease [Konateibacter massiliensis]
MSRKSIAIFQKQVKDTFKNKGVLVQFVMFPALSAIMQNAIQIEGMPPNYFVFLFATMYIGMAPLTAMSSILSEEKEYNTLRVLLMSNVKAGEYLFGVGSYIFLVCMLGSGVFAAVGEFTARERLSFLGIMAVGILISTLIGAAIGTWSKNQMSATSVTVVVMMIFSFLPMISMFNDTISKVSRFTYSQQLNDLMNQIDNISLPIGDGSILVFNVFVAAGLFVIAYRRCGLA